MMPEQSVPEGALYRCPLCNTLILEPKVKFPTWFYILFAIFLGLATLVEVKTIAGYILTKAGVIGLGIYALKFIKPKRANMWVKVDE